MTDVEIIETATELTSTVGVPVAYKQTVSDVTDYTLIATDGAAMNVSVTEGKEFLLEEI